MRSVNWSELAENEVVPGLYGKFFHTSNMTIVQWRFEAGAELPSHNHPHEQITMLHEGKLELVIDGHLHVLQEGDTITTSGYNAIFPEGIPIGRIKSYDIEENETFYNIDIELSSDFQALSHVYLISNYYRQEKDSVELLNE